MRKAFITALFFGFPLKVTALFDNNVFFNTCDTPYTSALSVCKGAPGAPSCIDQATVCANGCSTTKGFNSSEREAAPRRLKKCLELGGVLGGAPASTTNSLQKCLEGKAKINSGQSYDNAVWETCTADCSQAMSEATSTSDKNTYSQILTSCQNKVTTPETPVDPNGDLGDTVAEEDGATDDDALEPADSGLPNQDALNSAYQGLGMNGGSSRTPIDGGRGADFSGGGSSRGYEGIGQGGGGGPMGADTSIYPPVRVNDIPGGSGEVVQGSLAQPGAGTGGGGGAGMGGAGAGGSGSRGGAGGGGGRTSLAGAQLNKVGQNSFWAADGGGKTGGSSSSSRKTAATAGNPKDKKTKLGPGYIAKDDNALLRLFGNPFKAASKISGSQSCTDNTVFCTHESFFERVERYPSSEIKQTPQ